jgi:hypothetical protein
MRTLKTLTLIATFLFTAAYASAQTADGIIQKYLKAIGGKDQISKINSLYVEGNMEVMGNAGTMKTTTLNGKGYKQEMEFMGTVITNCINDKEGWSVNPMQGGTTAETIPEAQYKASKNQIYIGAPFIFYAEKGYKAELLGNENVGTVNANKVKLTAPEGTSAVYFFDPSTGYLLQTVQQMEMQGQPMESTTTFSDFRQVNGYTQPYKMYMNIGGQIDMTTTINKIEVNKPVDASIFVKP